MAYYHQQHHRGGAATGVLGMRRLDDPFFPVTPCRSEGMMERTGGHSIHWIEAGHPTGTRTLLHCMRAVVQISFVSYFCGSSFSSCATSVSHFIQQRADCASRDARGNLQRRARQWHEPVAPAVLRSLRVAHCDV
eukprot:COSAG02_NODE_2134_length_9720_cov_3.845027_3_plen_135_part_00